VYMLPQGMFAVAIATVIFPTLSRFAARGDAAGLRTTLAAGSRQLLLLLVPAAGITLALSEPITELLYERGAFDSSQTDLVSEALFFFSFALPFAGLNLIFTRAFFSLQSPWVPTVVALGNLGVNAALDAALYGPLGIGGIPLSTAIVSLITTFVLGAVLRSRLGGLEGRRMLSAAVRILTAGLLLVLTAIAMRELLEGFTSEAFLGRLVVVVGAGLAGAAAYVAAVFALQVEEAAQIRDLVRDQLARLR
jgi:putative peptidoglycan lipid II flippase